MRKSRGILFENKVVNPSDDHTGSDVNLELARYWLQDCLRNHGKCAQSPLKRKVEDPYSRMIDLGFPGKPYLIDTENVPVNND